MFKKLELFPKTKYPHFPQELVYKYHGQLHEKIEKIDETSLKVRVLTGRAFSPTDGHHLEIISCSTRIFSDTLKCLKQIDFKICIAFATGLTAIFFSVLLPFSTLIAVSAFSTAAYYIGKRTQAEHDYRNALENLVGCTQWTMSDVSWVQNQQPRSNSQSQTIPYRATDCEPIVTMFNVIAPWLTPQQSRDIIDDSVEDLFLNIADQEARRETNELLNRPLTDRERAKLYGIYGYQQGSLYDIGSGLVYLIGRCFRFLKRQVTSDTAPSPESSRAASSEVTHNAVVGANANTSMTIAPQGNGI